MGIPRHRLGRLHPRVNSCLPRDMDLIPSLFTWIYNTIESVMPSNHLILCCPLLLLPSTLPHIRVFSSELALRTKWPKYWSFSFSVHLSKEYSGMISFRRDWLEASPLGGTGWISLPSKGLSRVFSNIMVQKHPLFSPQPSLQSNSHICTWLLEKPKLWLDGLLLVK